MAGKGKTHAKDIHYGVGLTTSGLPPTSHDAIIADIPTLTTLILGGLQWVEQDVLNRFHDILSGTEVNAPTFNIGDRVQVYDVTDTIHRGDGTLVYYAPGAPTVIGLDDDDAKSITIPGDRVWPEGSTPGVDTAYLDITVVGSTLATGGGRTVFPVDLPSPIVVESIEVYRNGVIQQRTATLADAENLGASYYYYDSGAEEIQFGVSYPPAQGEELVFRARVA